MFALFVEVSFDRFGKELRFVSVCLDNFVVVAQCWIVTLTLWLEEVLDFVPRLALVGLKADRVAEFFPTSLRFYSKFVLNLFLQLVNARRYSRVFILFIYSIYSLLSPISLRFSAIVSLEMGLLSDRSLLDFRMALSTAVLITVTIKSKSTYLKILI